MKIELTKDQPVSIIIIIRGNNIFIFNRMRFVLQRAIELFGFKNVRNSG